MIQLGLQQRLVQNLQLGLGLQDPCRCLSGSPEDLETLLTDCPQEDEQGGINYLLSGGWAVEILTGKKREHHDLDIINLSRVPLNWRIDEQKPENYFGTISMRPQEMLDNHVQQTSWDMSESYPEISDSQFTVYVPGNEYLFLSKIAGFLREPRNKDYSDLQSLSGIMESDEESISKFEDLLKHVPGMHSQFHKNKKLFTDLSEYFKHMDGSPRKMAGAYLTEIIENFKQGNSDFAVKQASKFHETLRRVYEQGLQECISLNSEGISYDKFEDSWAEEKLSGFWVRDNGEIDLRIPRTKSNLKQLDHLRFWTDVEDLNKVKIRSLERAVDFSQVFIGKADEYKSFLITKKNPKIEKIYQELEFVPVSDTEEIEGKPKGLVEGIRVESAVKEKTERLIRDVYTLNGKKLFSSATNVDTGSDNIGVLYEILMADYDFENMKKLEEHAVANEGMLRSSFQIGRIMNYKNLLEEGDYGKVNEFGQFVDERDKSSEHRKHYFNLVERKKYKQARDFESAFDVDSDYVKEKHINKFLGKAFRENRWSSWINQKELKKAMDAQRYLKAEMPEDEIARDHAQLIREEKYSLADKFSQRFSLSEDFQEENRRLELSRWEKSLDKEPSCFALQKVKKLRDYYKQPLERDVIEGIIEKLPECSDAYLLVPDGELSPEKAIKSYSLLLKERRISFAEKIRNKYGLDNQVDYKLFCEDPSIYAHREMLKGLEIPIDEKSQAAALGYAEDLLFDKGHKRKNKAKIVIDKFQIPYESVYESVVEHIGNLLDEGNYKTASKNYHSLIAEEIVERKDLRKAMMKKMSKYSREKNYRGAAEIAEQMIENWRAGEYFRTRWVEQGKNLGTKTGAQREAQFGRMYEN